MYMYMNTHVDTHAFDSECVCPLHLVLMYAQVTGVHVHVYMCLQYTMEASFIEIYNETLRDLLSTGRKDKLVKHEIRLDSKNQGEVYVTNITPVTISSQEQVQVSPMC